MGRSHFRWKILESAHDKNSGENCQENAGQRNQRRSSLVLRVLQPEPAVGVVNGDGPIHSLVSAAIFAPVGEIIADVFVAERHDDVLNVELAIDERAAVVEKIEEVAAEAVCE